MELMGAGLGFISALFFAWGVFSLNAEQILWMTATLAGGNGKMAESLGNQRADFVVGVLLLLLSFGFQVGAIVGLQEHLPACVQSFLSKPFQVFLVLLVLGLAACGVRHIFARTMWCRLHKIGAIP